MKMDGLRTIPSENTGLMKASLLAVICGCMVQCQSHWGDCFLGTSGFTLAAPSNYLGSLKFTDAWSSNPGDSDLIGLGCSLGIWVFRCSPLVIWVCSPGWEPLYYMEWLPEAALTRDRARRNGRWYIDYNWAFPRLGCVAATVSQRYVHYRLDQGPLSSFNVSKALVLSQRPND